MPICGASRLRARRSQLVAAAPREGGNHPDLLIPTSKSSKTYAKLQTSAFAAVWTAQQADFDELLEHDGCRAEAEAAEYEGCLAKKLARPGIRSQAPNVSIVTAYVDLSVAAFDASTNQITALAEETFWKVLAHH